MYILNEPLSWGSFSKNIKYVVTRSFIYFTHITLSDAFKTQHFLDSKMVQYLFFL